MPGFDENRNIGRILMIGLIYPAVLGSIMYSFLGIILEALFRGASTGFLQQSSFEIVIKSLLLLTTLAFYGCDYCYTCWVAVYKKQFFILDLLVLASLYISILAINLNSTIQPTLELISVCYAFVLFFYFLWDFSEPSREQHRRYFRLMRIWEISGIVLMILFLPAQRLVLSTTDLQNTVLCILLLVITIWFWWLLYMKRRLAAY
jgi:hypothetical protein